MNDNGQHVDSSENSPHAEVLRAAGLAGDAGIDLAEVALALAAIDCPGRDVALYRKHLQDLQSQVLAACGAPSHVDARARALAQVIGQTHGYAGDTGSYDDMRNANLIHTIERRKGLPVALGILYIVTARGLGWECNGINFPAHFMIRLQLGQARRILDPFNGGKVVEIQGLREMLKLVTGAGAELKPEYYQPAGNRDLLLRLLNNIRVRAAAEQDFTRAAEILRRMLMIAPDSPVLWHDYGLTLAQAGAYAGATQAMQTCLEQARDPQLRQFAEAAMARLWKYLN